MITAYEIRFFQVGNASKGGDAIFIRFLDEYQRPTVIIVDGGYKETGGKIIEYMKSLNISVIDLVINTHPDIDHIAGLIRLIGSSGTSKHISFARMISLPSLFL